MNYAEALRQEIGSAVAWSVPVYYRVRITRTVRNQHGRLYIFEDGSRAFVAKGSALIRVIEPPVLSNRQQGSRSGYAKRQAHT